MVKKDYYWMTVRLKTGRVMSFPVKNGTTNEELEKIIDGMNQRALELQNKDHDSNGKDD